MENNKTEKQGEVHLTDFMILKEAAERLKCIAHPHRLMIIELLLGGEYTVGEIATNCKLEQSVASVHLRLMHNKNFLKSERRNRYVYYSLTDDYYGDLFEFVKSLHNKNGKKICKICGE